jgi:hypothetical protein
MQASSGSTCAQKRTDACGCHHHYGLRHCHPKKRTSRCEAPVKAQVPQASQPRPTPLVHL